MINCSIKQGVKVVVLALLMLCLRHGLALATTIQEVTSRGGVTAWLVEDHKLPLIAAQFAFRGGVEQDPTDKQGLANLTMDALTEGAGPYDATAFQQALADRSISLGFNAGRDALYGHLKALSADREQAFDLLRLAVTEPRLSADDIDRLKSAQLAALKQALGDPEWQGRYALFQYIFKDHPYDQRRLGSIASLNGLTRDDVTAFKTDHLARDNLVIAVAGDITPKELKEFLDRSFGDLPKHAHLKPIEEVSWPTEPATILTKRKGTQTDLLFAMPGPKRDDDDFYAAEIVDYTLGGGGFASRLMKDVREDKGLTYGISTGLSPMDHAAAIIGEAATDNDKTAEAWQIAVATMRKLYTDGMTEDEAKAAKDYLTGSMPLALTSTDKIADVLVEIQLDHLGIDYLDKRDELIRSVSAEDLTRVIHRWFNPAGLSLSMVGAPEGMAPTQTRELVRE